MTGILAKESLVGSSYGADLTQPCTFAPVCPISPAKILNHQCCRSPRCFSKCLLASSSSVPFIKKRIIRQNGTPLDISNPIHLLRKDSFCCPTTCEVARASPYQKAPISMSNQPKSTRSYIGRRIAQDVAIMRGAAERAAESLRIHMHALVVAFSARHDAALRGIQSGWKPLGVFGWQEVANAAELNSNDVDRVRSLQKFQRRTRTLHVLRIKALHVAMSSLRGLGSVHDSLVKLVRPKIELPTKRSSALLNFPIPRRAQRASALRTGHSAARTNMLRFSRLVAVRERAPKNCQKSQRYAMPSSHQSDLSTTLQTKVRSSFPGDKNAAVLFAEENHNENRTRPVDRTIRTETAFSRTSLKNIVIGTGMFALGLGSMLGGLFAPAVTMAASAALAVAVGGSVARRNRLLLPAGLPNIRRSNLVRSVDNAILYAHNTSAPVTQKVMRSQRQGLRIVPSGSAGLHSLRRCDRPLSVVSGHVDGPAHARYSSRVRRASDSLITEGSSVTLCRNQTESRVHVGNVHSSNHLSRGGSVPTNPATIDTDSYAVLPSEPAVFSYPVVGALLHLLDSTAYAFEQTFARLLRRAINSWFPRMTSGWKLHRTFLRDE